MARFPSISFTTATGIVTFTVASRGLQVEVMSSGIFTPSTAAVRLILEAPDRARLRQFLAEHYPGERGWL